jgi:predicted nucleic acid-binding Zn ribbon protein
MNNTDLEEKKRTRNNKIIGTVMFLTVLLLMVATYLYPI